MSRSRRLLYRIRRKKRWLREYLDQATVTDMYYKGYRIALVDIPPDEMMDAVAEAKALIDEIDKYRSKKNG